VVERLLRVGEVELVCDDVGVPAAPDALVLVHGYTGARRDFAAVAPMLAGAHRVVVLDQRGHGSSTWLRDERAYDLDALVRDLERALEALGIERAHLIGHSMGGQIVLRAALARPERVASLVLVSTWGGALAIDLEDAAASLRGRALDAVPFLRGAADAIHRARGRAPTGAPRGMDPVAYRALRPALRRADVRGRLSSLVPIPTTVIVGEADREFVPHARSLAAGIPGAELSVVAHAGHQVMSDRPRAFVELVEAHLARSVGTGLRTARS
jgi:pimeloyl-ACP methyl ester carboxylesterase